MLVTVTMRPPGYFKNPYIGPLPDGKRITRQPDKSTEITAVDNRDAQKLSEFAAKHLLTLIEQNWRPSPKRIRG